MSSAPDDFYAKEDRYGPVLSSQTKGSTLAEIWLDVYGPDYPKEIAPFGFLTNTEIRRVLTELRIGQGNLLADLGCGRGGPGLWIARQAGADLVGLDLVPTASSAASRRIDEFGLGGHAGFLAADCSHLALRTGRFDAVVSVDALWMVLDKKSVFKEVARILRPGGRLVFTTWEPTHLNYSALLSSAGFGEIARWSPPGWRDRQVAVYREILERADLLVSELGEAAATVLLTEARETPPMLAHSERLVISAARPS